MTPPQNAFGAQGSPCPCGSGAPYAACCRPLLDAESAAATAEQLMRSRYTAYAVGDAEYLLRTWHPRHRPAFLELDDNPTWTGLAVVATEGGGPGDAAGVVEFRAHYVHDGRAGELHEVSRFERRAGRWLYVDGDASPASSRG